MSDPAPMTKPKRALSAWNVYFAEGRKAGKTTAQVSEEWKTASENKKNKPKPPTTVPVTGKMPL